MSIGSARIDIPSRYVSVVLPIARGSKPEMSYDLVSDLGERVEAQSERVARYADGSLQAVQLLGVFKGAPKHVTVEPHAKGTKAHFAWTPMSLRAWRHLDTLGNLRMVSNGHAVQKCRIAGKLGVDGLELVMWVTAFSGSDCLRVDAVVHNAKPGSKQLAVPSIDLPTPEGYVIDHTIAEPLQKGSSLVLPNGERGYFPQRGRRILRFVWAPSGADGLEVDAVAHDAGWGVLDAWRHTHAFGAICAPLPDFGTVNVKGNLASDCARAIDAIEKGTGYPSKTYLNSKRLGVWHPCLGREGGETGGTWITQLAGATLGHAGTPEGLLAAMYEQRMATDRCHVGIVERDGEPATLENYAGLGSWRMRSDDPRFDKASGGLEHDGPFGFSAQPKLPPGTCAEQPDLDAFEPLDFGHWIRANRSSIALAWLSNDHLSRWMIRQEAELARMSMFNGRMSSDEASIVNGKGLPWGRIQGWMFGTIAEAYALGNDNLRTRYAPGIEQVLRMAERALMPCGMVTCDTYSKGATCAPYMGQYGVGICIMHGILARNLHALAMVTDSSIDCVRLNALAGVEFLLYGSNTLWSAAVRPKDATKPAYHLRMVDANGEPLDSSHPLYPDGKPGPALDNEQTRAVVGLYGLRAIQTGNAAAIVRAVEVAHMLLGPTPTHALLAQNMGCTDSDSLLLAFCQAMTLP
jgi:hypothetical protein